MIQPALNTNLESLKGFTLEICRVIPVLLHGPSGWRNPTHCRTSS